MRAVAWVLTVASVSEIALAGTVRGTVPLGEEFTAETQPADNCFWRLGSISGSLARKPAPVVVLEGPNANTAKPSGSPESQLTIEGYRIQPALAVVPMNTTIIFKNRDQHSYSCFAEGRNAFQFSELQPGDTHEQRFLSAGIVNMHCHLYPFMRLVILVVDTPLFTRADETGRFLIRQVPGGDYRIKVFANGSWKWKRDIQVPSAGPVRVAFEDSSMPSSREPITSQKLKPVETRTPVAETASEKRPVLKKEPSVANIQPKRQESPEEKPSPVKETQPSKRTMKDTMTMPIKPAPTQKLDAEKRLPGKKKPPKSAQKLDSEKRPPSKKKPPKEVVEPAFKDVEPEIEIEEE